MKISIFDLDQTLVNRDTLPFMMKCWCELGFSKKRYWLAVLKSGPMYMVYKSKIFNINRLEFKLTATQIFIDMLKGMSSEAVQEYFENCANMLKDEFLNDSVLEALRLDKENGHNLVLVSGTFYPFVKAVGDRLGFDNVIATRLQYSDDGIIDTKADLDYIVGTNKKNRLLELYEKSDIDWSNSNSYADGYADLDILKMVGNPCAVNPDKQLMQYAQNNNWRII